MSGTAVGIVRSIGETVVLTWESGAREIVLRGSVPRDGEPLAMRVSGPVIVVEDDDRKSIVMTIEKAEKIER